MHKTNNIIQTKILTQRSIKILLWSATLIIFTIVVLQIVTTRNSLWNNQSARLQTEEVQRRIEDLNEEADRLESSLGNIRLDDDIRALRGE